MQNYKQSKMIVWILFVIFIIHLPFQAIVTIENWREAGSVFNNRVSDMYLLFTGGSLPLFGTISIIVLAGLLIGIERNTRRNDFTFSLPFKRRDMFLAKWLFGAMAITLIHLLNFIVTYLMIQTTEFSYVLNDLTLTAILWSPLLGFLLLFSFAMFFGTIAGEMVSQVVLTLIFSIFPFGFIMLLVFFTEVNFGTYLPRLPLEWISKITLVTYVFTLESFNNSSTGDLITGAIIGTVVFFVLGLLLYERNRVEHNGEFLVFKQLHPLFLIGIVICFALFGGMILSSLVPWGMSEFQVIFYWIGFVIFALFSFLITRRLLRMNVTVKNK